MAKESREHLWQIITPLIVAAILGVASLVVGIAKLAFTSIADPYAGNIYWESCMKEPFQTERCFFTAYRIVNESAQPTDKPVKFDFNIYKPADAHLLPTRLSRKFWGRRPLPAAPTEETKRIVVSSSEIETEFEVYTNRVTPWDGNQAIEGWLRIRVTLPVSLPAGHKVDIVKLYCSYSPSEPVQIGPDALTINGVNYPDAASNRAAIARRKQIITSERETRALYWVVFLLLLALTFIAGCWFIRVYFKLKHEKEKLADIRDREDMKQRALQAEHETESKLEQVFEVTETDEEAMNGGRQRPPENNVTPPAANPEDSGDKKKSAKTKSPKQTAKKKKRQQKKKRNKKA